MTYREGFNREIQYFLTKSVLTPLAAAFADRGITLEMMQAVLELAPTTPASTPRRPKPVSPILSPTEKCIYIKRGGKACENKKELGKDYCNTCLKRPAIKKKFDKVIYDQERGLYIEEKYIFTIGADGKRALVLIKDGDQNREPTEQEINDYSIV